MLTVPGIEAVRLLATPQGTKTPREGTTIKIPVVVAEIRVFKAAHWAVDNTNLNGKQWFCYGQALMPSVTSGPSRFFRQSAAKRSTNNNISPRNYQKIGPDFVIPHVNVGTATGVPATALLKIRPRASAPSRRGSRRSFSANATPRRETTPLSPKKPNELSTISLLGNTASLNLGPVEKDSADGETVCPPSASEFSPAEWHPLQSTTRLRRSRNGIQTYLNPLPGCYQNRYKTLLSTKDKRVVPAPASSPFDYHRDHVDRARSMLGYQLPAFNSVPPVNRQNFEDEQGCINNWITDTITTSTINDELITANSFPPVRSPRGSSKTAQNTKQTHNNNRQITSVSARTSKSLNVP